MCHTDEDQELWEEDPYDFIRVKYGKTTLLSILKKQLKSLHHDWKPVQL